MTPTTNWRDQRTRSVRRDPGFENGVARERAKLEFATKLQTVREARERSQENLAATMEVSQANVSRIERQEDLKLSTLERYIVALGGRLEVRAIFDDWDVVLLGDVDQDER
jgi:DNA-binding XRE family transcriptional regulator